MITTLTGAVLLGLLGGLLGNLLLLRRMALLGDMMSHSLLPGLCVGFILAGYTKNYFYLFLGASFSALLANILNEWLLKQRPFKSDATLAILISGFYAIGALLIGKLSKEHGTELAGIKGYLLGQAALIQESDILPISILLLISVVFISLFYKRLILSIFDTQFLTFVKQKPRVFLLLSTTLIVFALLVSLQMVGAILAASFLLIPAAISLFLSPHLHRRFVYSALCGALIGACGTYLSSLGDRLPTGPLIVLCGFTLFILAATLGPHKSTLSVYLKKRELQKIRLEENILRAAYFFYEKNEGPVSVLNLMSRSSENRDIPATRRALRHFLKKNIFKEEAPGQYSLTNHGETVARSILRKHRIWETFIVKKLGVSPERAHDSAEVYEHYLDEEILRTIEKEVPTQKDPHGKKIPQDEGERE
ncbi:MAG: metal ABC transporter permease [Bdellovibrionota bacterium]